MADGAAGRIVNVVPVSEPTFITVESDEAQPPRHWRVDGWVVDDLAAVRPLVAFSGGQAQVLARHESYKIVDREQ
jgi:hypothetical protein